MYIFSYNFLFIARKDVSWTYERKRKKGLTNFKFRFWILIQNEEKWWWYVEIFIQVSECHKNNAGNERTDVEN